MVLAPCGGPLKGGRGAGKRSSVHVLDGVDSKLWADPAKGCLHARSRSTAAQGVSAAPLGRGSLDPVVGGVHQSAEQPGLRAAGKQARRESVFPDATSGSPVQRPGISNRDRRNTKKKRLLACLLACTVKQPSKSKKSHSNNARARAHH